MASEKPFIRVTDKETGHEYDVHEDQLNPEVHTKVKGVEPTKSARPPRFNVVEVKKTATRSSARSGSKSSRPAAASAAEKK